VKLFRRSKPAVVSLYDLPINRQWEIINEEALGTSIQLVNVQIKMWNTLVSQLEDLNIEVNLDQEVTDELNRLINQLRAATQIAYEIYTQKETQNQ
jgi:hypothetical protein